MLDFKRELKSLYVPSSRNIAEVTVPSFNFLMFDGDGDPNTSCAYKEAVEALFPVSYKVKFDIKKRTGADYAVSSWRGCGGRTICRRSNGERSQAGSRP